MTIERRDLDRLAELAHEDLEMFFARNPRWDGLYRDRILCVALCQGAARHFVDGRNGVKDWDVWTFFHEHPNSPFPPRRRGEMSFGDERFGVCQVRPQYPGRCVDLIGRSIPAREGDRATDAVRRYLSAGRTTSARFLAQSPVVLLTPEERRGEVIWSPGGIDA